MYFITHRTNILISGIMKLYQNGRRNIMLLHEQKTGPIFLDGLRTAYRKYDLTSTVKEMEKVLTAQERTKIKQILLSVRLRTYLI